LKVRRWETLSNIFPILPGLLNLARSVLPLSDGTPGTGAVEPPMPLTDAVGWFPYRGPVRHWYPPFGPPPVYVMPPVWTGTPYRPWPPYGGVLLPPIPPDLWGREPWWLRGPVFRGEPVRYREIGPPTPPKRPWYEVLPFFPGDPIPDMPSTQPVYDSAPPSPKQETPPPTPPKRPWYEVLPFFPGDPIPDMPSTQPVYDSAPPPPPPSLLQPKPPSLPLPFSFPLPFERGEGPW
jgi:hypothetical protein